MGRGPGFYRIELLAEVGRDGSVSGVDSSQSMLALATRRCAGHDNVELLEGEAVALPVADASFDAALGAGAELAAAEPEAALVELHRALRPGGRVLVWDIDWDTFLDPPRGPRAHGTGAAGWDEHPPIARCRARSGHCCAPPASRR